MLKFLCIICALLTLMLSYALHPDKCQETPKEKHCLIEYSVRYRWPHAIRFVYNWYTKSCFEIRWAAHCPPVVAATNNFSSQRECLDQCGGWA